MRAFFANKHVKISLAVLAVLALVVATPFFLPASLYKSFIEKYLADAYGIQVENIETFSLDFLPKIRLKAENVEITGQLSQKADLLGKIDSVQLDMDFWRFLIGTVKINELKVIRPNVTLNGEVSSVIPNAVRRVLRTSRKEEIRYDEFVLFILSKSIFEAVEITEGQFIARRDSIDKLKIQQIRLFMEKPADGGDLQIEGDAYLNGRSIDLSVSLQRPEEFLRGFRSKLTAEIDSNPFHFQYIGTAAHRHSFTARGAVRLEIPSVAEYCNWLRLQENCEDSIGKVIFESDLKLKDHRLHFEKARYDHSPVFLNGEAIIDFRKTIPELNGTINVPLLKWSDLAPSFSGLEEINFEDFLLEAFDANLDLIYQGIVLPNDEVIKPKVDILVNDGRLSLSADRVEAIGGLMNFRLRWHKGLDQGYLDFRLDGNDLDLEKLETLIGSRLYLRGGLTTSIEIQSLGSSYIPLLESSRIHGDYRIQDGKILSGDVAKSLNGQESDGFVFTEIKGRLRGDRGHISSKDISVVAPLVEVAGAGDVDFINKTLKLTLNGKARDHDGFVTLQGDWNNISLISSEQGLNEVLPVKELHSGLLPADDVMSGGIADDNKAIVLEENDLLE